MSGFIKKISIVILSTFLVLLVTIFSILWIFSNDLPNYKFLLNYEPPVSSRVHAGDGQLIAEFALQKRLFVPFEAIPKNVINSFLSAEDKNFIKEIKTGCLWRKKKSTFTPDFCAVNLPNSPWIVQPFETHEEIRIEDIKKKYTK